MPTHDEELKRFFKNPREEPDKKFSDSFKMFALRLELKEAINNPKGTKSEKESLKQYIELLENDNKSLDKTRLEAESRVSSLLDGAPLKHLLDTEDQRKGGSRRKYDQGLQSFIDRLAAEFRKAGTPFTLLTLKKWLAENAVQGDGYAPTAAISDCDDIEFFDETLWWKDRNASQKSTAIRTIERYIQRAKNPNLNSAA